MSEKSTKKRLLDSAVKLFAESGFDGVSVNDICQEAEANIAAVNYHFNNKQNLYDEAWKYAFAKARHPEKFQDKDQNLTPNDKLLNFIEEHINQALTNDENSLLTKLLLREFTEKHISDISIIFNTIKPLQEYITQVLREIVNNPKKEDQLPLLRFTLMSQCMMPLLSPIGKKHLLKAKPEIAIQHIYNVITTYINSM